MELRWPTWLNLVLAAAAIIAALLVPPLHAAPADATQQLAQRR